MKILKAAAFVSTFSLTVTFASDVFAQTKNDFLLGASTPSAPIGTSSGLPSAGTTNLTYAIFALGLVLFVVGTVKLVSSFKN